MPINFVFENCFAAKKWANDFYAVKEAWKNAYR